MSNENVRENSNIFERIRAAIKSDRDVLRSFAGNGDVESKSEEELEKIVEKIRKQEDSNYIKTNENFVNMYRLGNKKINSDIKQNKNLEKDKENEINTRKPQEKEYERGE